MHACIKLAIITYCWWAWFRMGHLYSYKYNKRQRWDLNAAKMIDNIEYAHLINTDNLVLSVYWVKVKTNREREKEIDWHMYVYIELRSFSLSLFSLSILFTTTSRLPILSLSLCPFFPTAKWSEYAFFSW